MTHVRKMALIDSRLLETLRTPMQPQIDPTLAALDAEMTTILDRTDLDVSEKVRLYNQTLLRYNDMAKFFAAKPTPVVVVKEKEQIDPPDVMADVVTTLPKALQEKGRQLMAHLKTTKWNDRGELLHEGVAIPGSNLIDLVHDLLRKRKTTDPVGWQQFANQMSAANIPMELVGNVARKRHIQNPPDVMADVVMTLPRTLQEKGRQLVAHLKTTKWNDRRELLHEGVAIPGSNVIDLVHDLLRKRKTTDPIGWQQFANQMSAANIPMELVGNVARKRHIQKRKQAPKPTLKPQKSRPIQLPKHWESY